MRFTKNGIIESAKISFEERGILDCWIMIDYGVCCQGFGGFALYLPKSWKHHNMQSVAGHHLYRIMQCAGVENWEDIKGKSIRVVTEGETDFSSKIIGIGHIIKDDFYYPMDDFKAVQEATQ